ncbi:MAG: hypothetical protein LQ349_002368 [Xanthoria aureola]|nr:MAG: hypothetical protein LQ349_002368 [Xanthoria aureola]
MGSFSHDDDPSTTFRRPSFQLLPIPSDADVNSRDPSLIRSLPDLVLFDALHNPHHLFCLQTSQASGKIGLIPITYHQLAVAVENCCLWLLKTIPDAHAAKFDGGDHVQKASPVALFLESDVNLFIYITALLALNIPCVLLSIRLSSTAVRKLLLETGASAILVSSRTSGHIEETVQQNTTSVHGRPVIYKAAPFTRFLPSSLGRVEFVHLPRCKHYVREDDLDVIILHSSGTTGLPKAIPLAHRYMLGYAACHELPESQDESKTGVNLSTLPLFHTVCFPPSDVIGNGPFVLKLLQTENITSLMTVPTILEEITQISAAKHLAALDFVVVGGGPIKPAVANNLHENGVSLLNHFGATELGALAPIFRPDKSYDWHYLRLRKDLNLLLRQLKPNDVGSGYKLSGRPFAAREDFELQDSLEINPKNPLREVRLMGRKDDLLVLATGEKVSPQVMEEFLAQDSQIKRAIVFGNGRFEIGVLIEPAQAIECSEADFVESIWPSILEANNKVDQHAVISTKAAILVKPPAKDVPLSDKGFPQRKDVYSVFESDIQSVYDRLEESTASILATDLRDHDLHKNLREVVQSCLPKRIGPEAWQDDDDFVQLGMDSLQATRLRRILNHSVGRSKFGPAHPHGLPPDFVYTYSSVAKLASAIRDPERTSPDKSTTLKLMQDFTDKYSFDKTGLPTRGNHTILLTGATGNLGSHMLPILSELTQVSHLISLVRIRSDTSAGDNSSAAMSVQKKALEKRGIVLSRRAWSKLKVLPWQPGEDRLGLKDKDYDSIASTVTHIFHGAWPMDFQMKLSSFENQIKALHDLIGIGRLAHSLTPTVRPRIILASSIAVAGNCSADQKLGGMIPEILLHNASQGPLAMGYAEAKWVCEQVVGSAHQALQREVEPMIVRIGQLSGSQISGYWSTKEHFPALVKASKAIGHLPELQGVSSPSIVHLTSLNQLIVKQTLSWLPVDTAARSITDLLLRQDSKGLVAHVENPVRQSWTDVCSILEYHLGISPRSRLPYAVWLDKVSKFDQIPSDLMEFFEHDFLQMSGGSMVLDTKECRERSPTLKSAGAIGPYLIRLYLSFWHRCGFLDNLELS